MSSTLASDLNTSDTSLAYDEATIVEGTSLIDDEIITVSDQDGNIERAQYGSIAANHTAGAAIFEVTAVSLRDNGPLVYYIDADGIPSVMGIDTGVLDSGGGGGGTELTGWSVDETDPDEVVVDSNGGALLTGRFIATDPLDGGIIAIDNQGGKTRIRVNDSEGATLTMQDAAFTAHAHDVALTGTESMELNTPYVTVSSADIVLACSGGSQIELIDDNIILTIPSADPHVAGALWNNAGVLTISAG